MKLLYIAIPSMFDCVVDLPLLKTLELDVIQFQVGEDFMKILSGCPNLNNFKTGFVASKDTINPGNCLKPLSTLINAEIFLFEVPYRAVYNVKCLTVFGFGRSSIYEEMNSFYKGFPVFENLTELRLYWCASILHDWDEVLNMLLNCPKLESLTIKKALRSTSMNDWKYLSHVPQCISSSLKKCKITHYEALNADFQFATYILQNARLLQVMTILHTWDPKPTESPQFLEDLSSCPRISPICKLSVSEFRYS